MRTAREDADSEGKMRTAEGKMQSAKGGCGQQWKDADSEVAATLFSCEP